MTRLTAVPSWLGFDWWYLLAASFFVGALDHYVGRVGVLLDIALGLWALVQAGWLKKVFPESSVLYWSIATWACEIATHVQDSYHAPIQSHWTVAVVGVVVLGCYAASVCVFIRDLRKYVETTDVYVPQFNYALALLFSNLYFQYKLHEIYEDQLIVASRLTP